MKRIFRHRYFVPAIWSTVVHLTVLFFFIGVNISQSRLPAIEPVAINSYLYQLPQVEIKGNKKKAKEHRQQQIEKFNQQEVASSQEKQIELITEEDQTIAIAKEQSEPQENHKTSTISTQNKDAKNSLASEGDQKEKSSFSAYSTLDSFSSTIDSQLQQDIFNELTAHKSLSSMHQDPDPVGHSITQLNADDPKEQARQLAMRTTHYGNTTIYKDENGMCTQITDLSNLGAGEMTSMHSFKCGESKMEKTFRLHMKALFEKNGRSKNSGAK